MTVMFRHQFRIDRIQISGNLEVENQVSIRGFSSNRTQDVNIDKGGSVKLMSRVYDVSCGKNKVFSEVQAHRLHVEGLLRAGALSIRDGLDTLRIEDSGDFQFYPIGNFSFDVFNVNGKMSSFGDVVLKGRSSNRIPHAFFGPRAVGVLKKCFDRSHIEAVRVTVNGQLSTGPLSVSPYWRELLVTGTFNFLPSESFNITTTTVSGTMRTLKPFKDSLPLVGDSLNVNSGGLLSLNYQQNLDDPSSGSSPSTIRMRNTVSISGRLEAGSLNIFADDLTVSSSGLVTVDWGGFASNQGPGAGTASSSGGSGASHGGRGGRGGGTLCHRLPYGSIYVNGTWGSGGGEGQGGSNGGRGGGKVYFEIENSVHLDGAIQTLGERGQVRINDKG